ncbi:MAG: ChaN family lipoprotein [Deltaproteobacteria bacterium]|nr:ChaN family lipoprotein [Deltaproteobacteria bacterium]
MSGPLSLQLALYRRQNARIAEAVQGHSPAFRAYEARYLRATSGRFRAVPRREVTQAIRAADVVYVGDYHTLRLSQRTYLELVDEARGAGRRVVLAVEFVEGRHQPHLDAYQAGVLSDRAFLARMGRGTPKGNELWTGFMPVLAYARRHGLEVVAVDKRSGGPQSLAARDAYTAGRVASLLRRPDRPAVMVLMGQYHVAPCHLPRAVEQALGPDTPKRSVVVYQNCERVWWSLARARRVDQVEAVRLSPGVYCLLRASPVVCQQSFLDYLEAERGDETLEESSVTERFRELAGLVGRAVGAPPGDALEGVVAGRTADPDFLSELQARGRLGRREMAQLRRHLLEHQSCYVPAARMACLASLSLNHAAEEATHFVRHAAVGEAMVAPRRPVDAFYARCMEEALGFLGSKLLNPRRACVDLAGWAEQFRSGRGEARAVAAFVLAHKATEAEGPAAAARLLPLRRERMFHALSHALGYMLGESLHARVGSGELDRRALGALFRDPFPDARAAYFRWVTATV